MINILVAEDDIKLNKLIRAVLENCGYRADMALDGQSAYDMFCEKHYDLVISDIMMPIADGYQLAENIRKINSTVPILFMTAIDDFDAKKRGYSLGIVD